MFEDLIKDDPLPSASIEAEEEEEEEYELCPNCDKILVGGERCDDCNN